MENWLDFVEVYSAYVFLDLTCVGADGNYL